MTYRVLVCDKLAPEGIAVLEAAEGIAFEDGGTLAPDKLAAKIGPYHGLIVRSGTRATAEAIAAAPNLRIIGRAGIGVDNIDVPSATSHGIVVMNTPGGNNVTTAEHTISMMLSVARSIPQATASMKAGKWEKNKFTGVELWNKTLGIVGVGNIGSLVAKRAQGLEMRVVAYDPFISAEAAARLGVELVTLDDLYARADFISVHTPMTPETKGLINDQAFAKMKKGVRIVNCARGGIIDEVALERAIVAGKVAGAALDVFAEEPPPADHPLLKLEQVICTPHLGASTGEAQVNVSVAVAEQMVEYLVGGIIKNAVNVPSISAELLEVLTPYLILGEKLGALEAQLLTEAPIELSVEYAGDVTEYDVKPITLAVLRGLLNCVAEKGVVNYVNAPSIAKERGLTVKEARTSQPRGYQNLVSVTAKTAKGTTEVAGAIFGRHVARLVKIGGFYLDAVPEGHILMLHNQDVPGVVGSVGTLLAREHINIARLELGRERVGGMAISLVHVDGIVSERVLDELRRLPSIVSAQLIEL